MCGQLGAQDYAVNVHIEHPPGDGVVLVDRATHRDDAGVVHHDVDGPQLVLDGLEELGEGLAIRHVQSAANLQAQPAARLLDGGFVDITDRDRGAQSLQDSGRGQPDAARPTCDGDYLSRNRHGS